MTPEPTSQQKQQGLRHTGQPVPDAAQHACERGAKLVPGTERETEATSSQQTCPRSHSPELSAGRRVGKKPAGSRAPAGMPRAEDGVAVSWLKDHVPRPLQASLPPETRQGPPRGKGLWPGWGPSSTLTPGHGSPASHLRSWASPDAPSMGLSEMTGSKVLCKL